MALNALNGDPANNTASVIRALYWTSRQQQTCHLDSGWDCYIHVNSVLVPSDLALLYVLSFHGSDITVHMDHFLLSSISVWFCRLHLKNEEIAQVELKQEKYVHKGQQIKAVHNFGFHTTTCCGYIPQDNTWTYTWQVRLPDLERTIQHYITQCQEAYRQGWSFDDILLFLKGSFFVFMLYEINIAVSLFINGRVQKITLCS